MERIIKQIRNALSILILTHRRPDGDGVGSMLALFSAFPEKTQKECYIATGVPRTLRFLPESQHITTTFSQQRYDTIIIVDCTDLERLDIPLSILKQARQIIFIDHHGAPRSNVPQATYYTKTIEEAASTTLMLYELFQKEHVHINQNIATCLLAGIFTDTGGFIHASTTPKVLNVSAELMRKGGMLKTIAQKTMRSKSVDILKLWGRALSRIHFNTENDMAYSVITYEDLRECHATLEDLSGLANIMSATNGTKYVLLLTEIEKNRIKGSFRSERDSATDVEQLAQEFGGGGHKLASGFEVEGQIIQEGEVWRII